VSGDADIPFDDLGDAEKVKFSQAELAATLAELDGKLQRLAALRTEAEDPDSLVRFTLGPDGRLLTLFLHEAVPSRLTNLALEQKLNDLFAAANEEARAARRETIEGE
jgi:predicted lipid carrier protein YhbT